MKRFGTGYGTELEAVAVPVGQRCERCLREITEQDSGLVLPDDEYGEEVWHLICVLDAILGPRWAGSFPRPRGTT